MLNSLYIISKYSNEILIISFDHKPISQSKNKMKPKFAVPVHHDLSSSRSERHGWQTDKADIICFPEGGKCRCRQHYDGLRDALLNVNDRFLISHTTLMDFYSQFVEGKPQQ